MELPTDVRSVLFWRLIISTARRGIREEPGQASCPQRGKKTQSRPLAASLTRLENRRSFIHAC